MSRMGTTSSSLNVRVLLPPYRFKSSISKTPPELLPDQVNLGGVAAPRPATRARRTTAAAVTAIRRQMRSLLRSCHYLGETTYGVLELAEQARVHPDAGGIFVDEGLLDDAIAVADSAPYD
jgi:hypothetical protein